MYRNPVIILRLPRRLPNFLMADQYLAIVILRCTIFEVLDRILSLGVRSKM
jgi:hypothetical protein